MNDYRKLLKFKTIEEALEQVEEFSRGTDINVPITLEDDNTYTFFGHGKIVARWICGDEEDDLEAWGIDRKPNPKKGHLVKTEHWKD
tara:strand:+ start:250 stop:510 length:261 start_codon:yes stop_codon:yes gene_type:complete